MSKPIYDKIPQLFKNRCENNLKKERKEAIFVKSDNNVLVRIFTVIDNIIAKVKELKNNLDPEVCLVIADKIKHYYINSDLDPQSLTISYKLFKGISDLLDLSKDKLTLGELDQLTETTKRYYFESRTDPKLLKKSLHLYENLKQDLSKS